MTALRTIKAGDLSPLTITVTLDNAPVDLTPASEIRVIAKRPGAATPIFSRVVAAKSNAGVVILNWVQGDTAVPGLLNLEVQVTWADGTIRTYPGTGFLQLLITRDLG